MNRLGLGGVVTVALLAASAEIAQAGNGGIAVNRTAIVFAPGNDAQAFSISGAGTEGVHVQVRLFRWHNGGTGDVYEQTQDIGFSPAIFSLEPGASQVVRLVLISQRGPAERAYRLFVDQLPPPPRAGAVTLPVRFVIPVFVEGVQQAAPPSLMWTASVRSGQATLTAANAGGSHARLVDLAYIAQGQRHAIAPGLSGYVLPGEQRSWTFPYRGSALDIVGHTEQEDIHTSVSLAAQ